MATHGRLIHLSVASFFSVSGTRLSTIAIPWLVLTTTDSALLTGLVVFAEMLPYVIAKALSGPIIDRLGPLRISVVSDYASAAVVASIPILYWIGFETFWIIVPIVAALGMVRGPADAAKQALVPRIAADDGLTLERVTGVLGTSNRLAGTAGAAGAGVLIATFGVGPALVANAAAFVVSAVTVAFGLRRPRNRNESRPNDAPASYRDQFLSGWRTFSSDPVLVTLVAVLAVTSLFDQAYATVLLPVWVREAGLEAGWVGTMLAVFSGTAILGAAYAAIMADRLPRMLVYVIGFAFAGPIPMAAFAFDLPLPAILTVLLISGLAAGFLGPIIGVLLFSRIPKASVGRVISLVGSLTWVLIPFGGIYAGVLIETLGVDFAMALTGALYAVVILIPMLMASFRAAGDRTPSTP